jgi:hypothetical protein
MSQKIFDVYLSHSTAQQRLSQDSTGRGVKQMASQNQNVFFHKSTFSHTFFTLFEISVKKSDFT